MSKGIRFCVLSAVILILSPAVCTFAQETLAAENDPWLRQELVFGQFTCSDYDPPLMDFEGTSGISSNRFEIQRFDLPISNCPGLAGAMFLKAQELDCIPSPVRTSSFGYTSMHVMCHGDRGAVISAIAALTTEMLTFPVVGGAPLSRDPLMK